MSEAAIARIPAGTVSPDGDPIPCVLFLLCTNDATVLLPHPILDATPACERCAVKLGYDLSGDLPDAEITFEEVSR